MTIIDNELNTIFTNDSIPINIGWEYRLMGKGDDYVEVVDISGKYVTIRGISGIILEKTMQQHRVPTGRNNAAKPSPGRNGYRYRPQFGIVVVCE